MGTQNTAFTLDPGLAAELEAATDPAERMAVIEKIRRELDVPDAGPELRNWIAYHLKRVTNPETGRGWNQADVARKAGEASGPTVSRVLLGELPTGRTSTRIREVASMVLGLPVEVIWKPSDICAECGAPLSEGDRNT